MEYRRDSHEALSPFEIKFLTDLHELNILSDVVLKNGMASIHCNYYWL